MNRRKKVVKIHETIMCASGQIEILSKLIENYTYCNIENQICANIINEKSKQIFCANEKLSKMF
jgi:hypothetical protein